MNKKVVLSSSLVLVALASYASLRDPVKISWKPKVGDAHTYKWKSVADNVQGSDMKLGSDMTETVKAINADGSVVVEDKQTHLSLVLGGNDLSNNPQIPQEVTETITEAPNGHVLKRVSDQQQGDSPRINAISQFIYPDHAVNVGDTWTFKGAADKAAGTNDYQIDYTYQGKETADGVDAYKITVSFKELNTTAPISGSGTVWVAADSGSMVKMSAKLKNADLGPLGTTDLSVDVDRQS
ncbi:MAG TPA: hypothetical protein VGL56_21245 [Fimbriimonadaceae bacterium]|jgi:hypothetical protein